MDKPVEPITPTHLRDGWPHQSNHGLIGCPLIQRSVRSVPVEVIDVLGRHLLEVSSVDGDSSRARG
jgi:hypothetical protein